MKLHLPGGPRAQPQKKRSLRSGTIPRLCPPVWSKGSPAPSTHPNHDSAADVTAAGTVFNHPIPHGNQYFIDWRNTEAAAYFVSSIVNATTQPGVDITFTDDREGVPCGVHLSPSGSPHPGADSRAGVRTPGGATVARYVG